MKRLFALSFIILSYALCAQRELTLRRILQVKCPNTSYYTERCAYALLVPVNRPGKQEVINYSYPGVRPDFVTVNKNKETYLHWNEVSLWQLKDSLMEVSMKIKIWPYDLKTAKKRPVHDKKDRDTLSFLKDEENFRSESRAIQTVAAGIKGKTREEIVKNIFQFVTDTLDYKIFYFQDRGAKQALKEGKGDCTEYSELMVTLCRAKKIPARIVEGLIPKTGGQIAYHNWVEVFFPEYGWVAFDPTWADHPKASTTFYKMKNSYIQLTNQRYVKHIEAPCGDRIPYLLYLKDTCTDVHGISTLHSKMLRCYNDNENEKALQLLDTLILYEPDNYSYWMFRGVALARMGQFEKGMTSLQTSQKNVETKDEEDHVVFARANYYALKNEGDSALKCLNTLSPGFLTYARLEKDSDFEKIKNYPPYAELLQGLKKKEEEELLKQKKD